MLQNKSPDTFQYRPSIWFVSPLLAIANLISYLLQSHKKQGIAAANEQDVLPIFSYFWSYFPFIILGVSIIIAVWAWHLYFKSTRIIKLTPTSVSAPKHFASRQMVEILFSDVTSIETSNWSDNLLIHHKSGRLTIDSSGFRDKLIRNSVFYDIKRTFNEQNNN